MDIKAYAKLNLFLNVHGKSFNNYHNIESVMVPLYLHDLIKIEIMENTSDILITSNNLEIPNNESNILFKCARLFQTHFNINFGFKIYLKKNIPIKSGLGGESADAAAFMHYLKNFFKIDLSIEEIFYYGRMLSWDVPICFLQQYVYVNDIKSVCTRINSTKEYYILLIKPNYGISTKDAFIELDQHESVIKDVKPLLTALENNIDNIGSYLHNCFIYSNDLLKREYSYISSMCNKLNFDGSSMTGTGSCFFMATSNYDILLNGYKELKKRYSFVCATRTNLKLQEQ